MVWKVIGDDGRLAPVIVQIIVLLAFVGGSVFGYWVRMQLESRAELSVVLDDEQQVQEIERETEEDLKTHAAEMEALRNVEVDDCFRNTPLPSGWFDIVQPSISETEQYSN